MWRSHMIVGASSWLGAQTLAGPLTGSGLDTRERACGALIAAGAALLCDIGTPSSRLANALGAVTRLAARLVGRAFGGHRHGTHSLLFCAAVGALSALALTQREVIAIGAGVTVSAGQLAALAIGYLAAALSVTALLGLHGARAGVVAALLVAAAASTQPPAGLVSAAVTTGCASHLLADLLTPEGIAPLWPFSERRVHLQLIHRTGDWRESVVVLLTAVVTIAITWTTR
jgi:membrane-bound metal-dependent hydrolase YbcI (DUF457 family)